MLSLIKFLQYWRLLIIVFLIGYIVVLHLNTCPCPPKTCPPKTCASSNGSNSKSTPTTPAPSISSILNTTTSAPTTAAPGCDSKDGDNCCCYYGECKLDKCKNCSNFEQCGCQYSCENNPECCKDGKTCDKRDPSSNTYGTCQFL